MLDEEMRGGTEGNELKVIGDGKNPMRRASDPALFSKDHKKSLHREEGQQTEGEDKERKVMTEPLTPERRAKYAVNY